MAAAPALGDAMTFGRPPSLATATGQLRRGRAAARQIVARGEVEGPRRKQTTTVAALAFILALPALATAQERYALVVSGATGGAPYAQQYTAWTKALTIVLVERLKFDPARIVTLSESPEPAQSATAANVRRALALLRTEVKADDLLLVFLIGHGTFDGVDAKFNLVGPDMDLAEWSALVRALPGRVVVVNSASASAPFVERLSGPRRIVVSATASVAQRFDTVFPEYFIAAFGDESSDIDKNGRTSIWEAFAWADSAVRRHYQQRGQLATERPLLDDNGDGAGREASSQGADGSLSSRTYLDAPPADARPTDDVLVELLQRRASLIAESEELQVKKAFMSADEYGREFERIMVALARVARDIRARNPS
jgi:hypothetical protein